MLSLMSACDNGMGHCLLSIETQIISIRSLQSSSEGLYFFYSCTMTHPPSSQIATIAPRCLLHLNFPGFYLAMKREAWLLWTWFYIALVNKLVSLTWFLWALRSFQRFTLHFFNTYHNRFQIDEVADVELLKKDLVQNLVCVVGYDLILAVRATKFQLQSEEMW